MNLDTLEVPRIRHGLEGSRILIIEEEPIIGLTEAEILVSAGCQVVGPAATVAEAARLIATTTVDAAIVDATIKSKRTGEILAALATQNIPFAVVTAFGPVYGRTRLPRRFRDAPILDKPFKARHLVAVVEALLNPRFAK